MQVRHRLLGAAGTVAAAIVMVAALGPAARADTGFETILAYNSFDCLDVRAQDNYYSPGARIQQWSCSGAAEQQWSFHPYATVPTPGNPAVRMTLYQIKSLRSGLCMEADAGGVHALIRQNTCATATESVTDAAHQLWRPVLATSSPYVFNLKPWSAITLCADIAGASDDDWALLQLFTCTGNTNQQFDMPSVS